MSDSGQEADQPSPPEPSQEPERMSLAEFLESVPPSQVKEIKSLVHRRSFPNGGAYYALSIPEIRLHCGDSNCGGMRIFRCDKEDGPTIETRGKGFSFEYVPYKCSNCQATTKTYSLAVRVDDIQTCSGRCYKFGELPVYGPPTPSRLISLIGPDRELFLQGRRCESQGLGIGAFVYYRRVVENQKDRILGKVVEVARMLNAPADMVATLTAAQTETQFHKALQSVKDSIPESLKIKGQNPLTLLHSALSDGLHARDDQTCLSLAHAIRVVLAELSDRIGQTLRDDREIGEAVSLLMESRDA